MIDDIDLHLHPKWQRMVVPSIARAFPKLQFIVTSHSPLVAGTLHAKNVRVIESNQIRTYQYELHGMSADQILLSDYFNMDTTRSEAKEKRLSKISENLADTGDPKIAIEYLRELAGNQNGKHK